MTNRGKVARWQGVDVGTREEVGRKEANRTK